MKLIQKQAGVETERSSAAVTWTAGTAVNLHVRCVSNFIRTYSGSTLRNTYTLASFNQTATGVKVSGFATGANLAAWARSVSGATRQWLRKFMQ